MDPISVAFDREIFLLQQIGGVSNYFSKVIDRFLELEYYRIKPHITFRKSRNFNILEVARNHEIEMGKSRKQITARNSIEAALIYGPIKNISAIWSAGFPIKKECDIFHATYYRPLKLEKIQGRKLAITIHDFIPEKLGWNGIRNPHIGKKNLAHIADIIFCVSQETANDLAIFYGISDERVIVARHGVSGSHVHSENNNFYIPKDPYILYVGHRAGYKNFDVLPAAMSLLTKKFPELKLIIAGPNLTQEEILNLNRTLGDSNWEIIGNPVDDHLRMLYRKSLAHCLTSKYEGFGMTILEAMVEGAPVILSDIPVFREVAGDSALYFDSKSPDHLASRIEDLFDSERILKLKQAGILRASSFTWEKTAAIMADSYKNVL